MPRNYLIQHSNETLMTESARQLMIRDRNPFARLRLILPDLSLQQRRPIQTIEQVRSLQNVVKLCQIGGDLRSEIQGGVLREGPVPQPSPHLRTPGVLESFPGVTG